MEWSRKNRSRRRAAAKAWAAAHPESVKASRTKERKKNFARYAAYERRRNYGLSVEAYAAMVATHGGVCAICGKPETVKNRALSVDHDHATGRVRGLLCLLCNRVVGCAKDSAGVLRSAANYLDRHAVPLTGEQSDSPVNGVQ